eukprot:s902_g6.t1
MEHLAVAVTQIQEPWVGGLMAIVRQMWYIAVVVICLTYASMPPNVVLQRVVAGAAPPGRTGEALATAGVFSMLAGMLGNMGVASFNPVLYSFGWPNPLWVYYPVCGLLVLLDIDEDALLDDEMAVDPALAAVALQQPAPMLLSPSQVPPPKVSASPAAPALAPPPFTPMQPSPSQAKRSLSRSPKREEPLPQLGDWAVRSPTSTPIQDHPKRGDAPIRGLASPARAARATPRAGSKDFTMETMDLPDLNLLFLTTHLEPPTSGGWARAHAVPEDDDEPPGPAGRMLALPGARQSGLQQSTGVAGKIDWVDNLAWLRALKHLQLPFDVFTLGQHRDGSLPGRQTLASLRALTDDVPQRCCLLVLVRTVEVLAGEVEALLCDPTGSAWASMDRRVAGAWPKACCEGSVLVLLGALALPGPRLFVGPQAVTQVFPQSDSETAEVQGLSGFFEALLPLLGTPRGGWGAASGAVHDQVFALAWAGDALRRWKAVASSKSQTSGLGSQEPLIDDNEDELFCGAEESKLNLDKEIVKELRFAFEKFDRNGNGKLSSQEISMMLKDSSLDISDADIEAFVHEADVDLSGELTFDEFLHILQSKQKGRDLQAELVEAFKVIDKNQDGFLAVDELREALGNMRIPIREEELTRMFQKAGHDRTGKVSFKEFEQLIRQTLIDEAA